MERLQKLIAQAGICSRRKAEQLIQEGRVTVNGQIVTTLGTKADVDRDHIRVDGKRLRFDAAKVYLLLNKPRGYLCTLSDPEGRPKVTDLIKGVSPKVYPVGRLDFQSEGLLLLTNDGDLANIVLTAGERCPKKYVVKVKSKPSDSQLRKISEGLSLEDVRLAPCRIELFREGENPWYTVTLIEGKNNQIRRMFERINHPVLKLKRIQIGFLRDPHLQSGRYRPLTGEEVRRFKSLGHERSPLPSTD
ncbi:MAG: pseudouridine synthase [Acidobacteriota bacterium]